MEAVRSIIRGSIILRGKFYCAFRYGLVPMYTVTADSLLVHPRVVSHFTFISDPPEQWDMVCRTLVGRRTRMNS